LKRYLLDTGSAADYLNRRGGTYSRARQERSQGARLRLGAPVLGELWDGVFYSATRQFNESLLKQHIGQFAIWPFDQLAAVEYGKLSAELRRRGRNMQQIDIQIAAIARCLADCTVISKDTDLRDVPGLIVENWA